MSTRFTYPVVQVTSLTRQVSCLRLQAPLQGEHLSYQAGQYLSVLHAGSNAVSPLSIASSPSPTHAFDLHVSHASTNQQAHAILAMANTDHALSFTGPYGFCTVSRFQKNCPIIFYVRGTGFVPAKAMLEVLAQQGEQTPLFLYWGVAEQADFYLTDLLQHWQRALAFFRCIPVVSRSRDQHQLHHAVIRDFPDMSHVQVYASGGEDMVLAAREHFQQQGLPTGKFYSDWLDFKENN